MDALPRSNLSWVSSFSDELGWDLYWFATILGDWTSDIGTSPASSGYAKTAFGIIQFNEFKYST